MSFADLPKGANGDFVPFRISIPEKEVEEMRTLIKSSKIAPETFESLHTDKKYGLDREWLLQAQTEWLTKFVWTKAESRMNSYPQFTTTIEDDRSSSFTLHFVALFSKSPSAIPLLMCHGWPGSFLEFLPILSILQGRYTPDTLPYHIVIPSIPGYTFSSGPPLDRDYGLDSVSLLFDKLMKKLGFGSGYVAQGGDLGSRVVRGMATQSDACKAVHVNFLILPTTPTAANGSALPLTEIDKKEIEKLETFRSTGGAYAMMHATRPSTIGLVLQSSPIALLAWIAEKMLEWTDTDPPLETILEEASLYWLTDTIARSVWPYRRSASAIPGQNNPGFIDKPLGLSNFHREITCCPPSWAGTVMNLKFYRRHEEGGHFAALEKPEILLKDVEDFIKEVWK